MVSKGYSNLALPTELVNAVRDVVNDRHSLYVSISDFVKEAVREKLQQHQNLQLSKANIAESPHTNGSR